MKLMFIGLVTLFVSVLSASSQEEKCWRIWWNDLPDGISGRFQDIQGYDVNDAYKNFRAWASAHGYNALPAHFKQIPCDANF
jgi:hypothetical protein